MTDLTIEREILIEAPADVVWRTFFAISLNTLGRASPHVSGVGTYDQCCERDRRGNHRNRAHLHRNFRAAPTAPAPR